MYALVAAMKMPSVRSQDQACASFHQRSISSKAVVHISLVVKRVFPIDLEHMLLGLKFDFIFGPTVTLKNLLETNYIFFIEYKIFTDFCQNKFCQNRFLHKTKSVLTQNVHKYSGNGLYSIKKT